VTSGNDAEDQPRSRPPAYYAEDHCALNWRFVSAGLLAPVVVIAAGVAAVVLDNAASWAPLGVVGLAVPFMRAAVVILVDREQCTLPRIGPARGLLSVNWSGPGSHQPLWVVPTRHPAELEAALAALPLPTGTVGDPYPGTADKPSITDWFAS
jgi:hypothetical protein